MKELNSFEFNFKLENMDNAFDFAKVGCMELAVYSFPVLVKPGSYQFKLVVSELEDDVEIDQNRVEEVKHIFEEVGVYDTNPFKSDNSA